MNGKKTQGKETEEKEEKKEHVRSRETGGGATAGRGTTPHGVVGGHFNAEVQAGKSILYTVRLGPDAVCV